MYRDLENVPYRETPAYARAVAQAAIQRAAMRHQVRTLWPSQSGQSTSGMVRTPRFGHAG
jgi:hypothetical protein